MGQMSEIDIEAKARIDQETEGMDNYDREEYFRKHIETRRDQVYKEYLDAARMVR
jgi:CRISPR/Cas system-associated protein Csm6